MGKLVHVRHCEGEIFVRKLENEPVLRIINEVQLKNKLANENRERVEIKSIGNSVIPTEVLSNTSSISTGFKTRRQKR